MHNINIKEEIESAIRIAKMYENYGPPYLQQHIDIHEDEECEFALNAAERLIRFVKLFETLKCKNCYCVCRKGDDGFCSNFENNV